MDEQESIERRLELARRHGQKLEEQLAVFGRLNAPTHLQIQLEDVRAEIAGLEEQLARIQRGEPPPPRPACPYPGMVPFGAEDARSFYGRDAEIRDLLQRLRRQRYFFVIGPSGSGKSSLIFAGLLPRLREAGSFPDVTWLVRDMRPGAAPTQTLLGLLEDETEPLAGPLADARSAIQSQAQEKAVGGQPRQRLAPGSPGSLPRNQRLLLVIDQFEELFTQADRSEQIPFQAALKALRGVQSCTLILTMRADFYSNLMQSDLWPLDDAERIEVARLGGEELREAIEKPASKAAVRLEPDLLERLVNDAANEPGVLPLVQETMRLLWGTMQDGVLTLNAYERLGTDGRSGLAVAVAVIADATLTDLTPAQRQIARRIFLNLVQLGEGGPDTRRQRPLRELRSTTDKPGDFEATVEQLTRNRLITRSDSGNAREPVADLSHEVLITGWPRLREWLEDRAGLFLHQRLTDNAREWLNHGHDPSFLYGGGRLTDAQRYADEHPQDMNPDEVAFLAAGAAREVVRERARYIGQAAGGALGAALGYGLAFALGFWDTNRNLDLGAMLIMFLIMCPFGELVGFCIGIGLWRYRRGRARRMVANGFIGGLSSSASYAAALWISSPSGSEIALLHVAVGAVMGAGLGVGAALTNTRRRYLLGTTLGGLFGAMSAFISGGLHWSALTTLVAGLALGSLTGLGFQTTAVENNDILVG
jgi:hypothetical protein